MLAVSPQCRGSSRPATYLPKASPRARNLGQQRRCHGCAASFARSAFSCLRLTLLPSRLVPVGDLAPHCFMPYYQSRKQRNWPQSPGSTRCGRIVQAPCESKPPHRSMLLLYPAIINNVAVHGLPMASSRSVGPSLRITLLSSAEASSSRSGILPGFRWLYWRRRSRNSTEPILRRSGNEWCTAPSASSACPFTLQILARCRTDCAMPTLT